jgi:hypothetical protein
VARDDNNDMIETTHGVAAGRDVVGIGTSQLQTVALCCRHRRRMRRRGTWRRRALRRARAASRGRPSHGEPKLRLGTRVIERQERGSGAARFQALEPLRVRVLTSLVWWYHGGI